MLLLDCPAMRTEDISFACHTILNTILPSSSLHHGKPHHPNQNGTSSNSSNFSGHGPNNASYTHANAQAGVASESVTHVPKAVNNSPNPPHNPPCSESSGAMFDSFYESGFLGKGTIFKFF